MPNFVLANEEANNFSLFNNINKVDNIFEFPHENLEFANDQMNFL